MTFLQVDKLTKIYFGEAVEALRGVSFTAAAGEIVALMGPSGCGKSTLLNIIGALDVPSGGALHIDGKQLAEHGPSHLFRARTIGFVFQFHHLVSGMTLAENVAAPLVAQGIGRKERLDRALELLKDVELEHRAGFLPNRVSGGERQRAAVARALVAGPRLLLADEPTGNLDTRTGNALFNLMISYSRRHEATVIIATHNDEIAAKADRIIRMRDGLLIN
jgi:ABC-type lipoprotein export system ATPase subunit